MATQRLVSTNFWKDTYVIDLDPVQKLLFLYFLTNPRTTLAGVYELSIREAAFDTGIDKDMVEKILAKFCADGKMHYEKGWLVLRNFVKHQRLNPSIQKGIEKAVAELPEWLQDVVNSFTLGDSFQGSRPPDSPQTPPSLPPIEAKLIEAKGRQDKLKKANGANAPAESEVGRLYYQAIKALELPIRNHANVRAKIKILEKHARPELVKRYLVFMRDQFATLDIEYKPEINEALDIYAKMKQVENAVIRATKPKSKGTTVSLSDI